jgi:hypothetical protein
MPNPRFKQVAPAFNLVVFIHFKKVFQAQFHRSQASQHP